MFKYFCLAICFCMLLIACNGKKKAPNVNNISFDANVISLNKLLLSYDTNSIVAGITEIKNKYPVAFKDFATYVYQGNVDVENLIKIDKVYYDSDFVKELPNTDFLKDAIEKALKYQKYYFPESKVRKEYYTYYCDPEYNNGGNILGITLGENSIGFGMQFYMGANFGLYQIPEFAEIAPAFRSRKFTPAYMVSDMVQKIIEAELYKPAKGKNNLIDQMIEKGKQWYIKKQLLPNEQDTIITGFTQYQLAGCINQEGLIWKTVLTQDPNTNDNEIIRGFLGDAPYSTATGNLESPGNIGQWIGLRIVEAFAENNNSLKLDAILNADSQEILEKSKYRPK